MKYFSPIEIAEMLGVTPKTTRRWIADGALPAHCFGRLLRVSEVDLQAFLDERQTAPRTQGHALGKPVSGRHRDSVDST